MNKALQEKNQHNKKPSQFEVLKAVYWSGILRENEISPSTKLVLMALVNHYNPDNKDVFPSQEFISKQLGISEKSVQRAIKELKEKSLILYVNTQSGNHYYFSNVFFEQIGLSDSIRQNVGFQSDKLSDSCIEQKKEHKSNSNKVFLKVSELSDRRPYHYNNQQLGQNYKTPEQTKAEISSSLVRDDKTPMNDKETAIKYVAQLSNMLENPFIKNKVDEVKKRWGL
jgi:DNA-binding MarR family transcriptional regulator